MPPDLAGRGLAVAMAGIPVALSIGTPVGTFLGGLVGWRWAFAAMSVLALLLIAAAMRLVPDAAGQDASAPRPSWRIVRLAGLTPVLFVVLGWMLAHNLLYTYIAPYLSSTGIGVRVDVVLLVFGLAALPGIWATGVLVDRMLRRLVLANLCVFAGASIVLGLAASVPALFYVAVLAWGLSFGSASTLLNTAAADTGREEDTDPIAATVSTVWNLAIFGGSALGAGLLVTAGPSAFPWALTALSVVSLGVAALARRHGFRPGPRTAPPPT